MRFRSILLAAALAMAAAVSGQSPVLAEQTQKAAMPLTIKAADGVTVYGDYYRAEKPKALILLFHQAQSSKGEYATIAPRLVAAGYSALAIDQRAGGTLFGPNETVKHLGRSTGYMEARADLEAALGWAKQQSLPVIIWGSSYSAALVFLIAADHPEVKAVLSFSPGEYLGGSSTVRDAAAHVSAPVFVTSADSSGEVSAARAFAAASPATVKQQYVPQSGVHGSSTLIEQKNPHGAADNWKAVLAFLDRLPLGNPSH